MKKFLSKVKGFTLVELIVVITIIGILAAVLVPTITNYIEKARFSNDVSDAKNMSTILMTNAVELDMTKLEAPDIRNLINSTDKNYTFVPKSKKAHFWYNTTTGKVEVTDSLDVSTLQAAGSYTPKSIEEVFDGKLYLNVQGELASALNNLRNLTSTAQYDELKTKEVYGNVNIAHILEEFDPATTLFVNAQGGFTNTNVKNAIQKVVFAENISVIPNMDVLMVQMLGTGKTFAENVKIVLPNSVQIIMSGAFSTPTSKLTITKNTAAKIQVLENAFNKATEEGNFIAKPNISYEDYLEKIRFGNSFVDVIVYLNNIGNYNTGLDPEFAKSDHIILRPGTTHTVLEKETQVEDYLMLNATMINKKAVVKADLLKTALKTDRLMAQFPNITSISANYYSNKSGNSFINFVASDPTGIVVNLTIRTHQK